MSLHCLLERLLKHFSRRQKQSNFVVIGALRVNRAKQLNRRRHIRLVCLVNVRRKLKSYLLRSAMAGRLYKLQTKHTSNSGFD